MRFDRHSHDRPGASEIIGAVLAIAVTLVAGAAAWGFVRAEAVASEDSIQSGAVGTNDYLAEHFSVVDMYFPTTTSVTFWTYNTGTITDQLVSVRLYDSAGLINVYYNSTTHSPCSGDCVSDLRSTLTTKCKTAASSYESISLTTTTVKSSNTELYTLTIPPTATNCPSFGQSWVSGTTYTIVATGVYGNSVTYSQTR